MPTNPRARSRPNIRQIAEKAGVHFSTVSLALRDSPNISTAVRRRIQSVAESMEYHSNPLVSSLMAQVRASKPIVYRGNIAFLLSEEDLYRSYGHFRIEHEAMMQRAASHGYNVEMHFASDYRNQRNTLASVLRARGVEGIISDLIYPCDSLGEFDWSTISWVCLGHRLSQLESQVPSDGESPVVNAKVPFVVHNHFSSMYMVWDKLPSLGYVRPGLCIEPIIEMLTEHHYTAAFEYCQNRLNTNAPIPVFIGSAKSPAYKNWLSTHEPDVILSNTESFFQVSQRQKNTAAFVNLDWIGGQEPGIAQRRDEAANKAVDLLVEQILTNKQGRNPVACGISIDGYWVDGDVTRQANAPRAIRILS